MYTIFNLQFTSDLNYNHFTPSRLTFTSGAASGINWKSRTQQLLVLSLQLRFSPGCPWLTCRNYNSRIHLLVLWLQHGQPSPLSSRNPFTGVGAAVSTSVFDGWSPLSQTDRPTAWCPWTTGSAKHTSAWCHSSSSWQDGSSGLWTDHGAAETSCASGMYGKVKYYISNCGRCTMGRAHMRQLNYTTSAMFLPVALWRFWPQTS